MMARALEAVGERWGLLIVRDLLEADRRFTDLLRSCADITPRQLTSRLRQLERSGIVSRASEEGRREVWYRLTSAGRELEPAVDALTLWGSRHAAQSPLPNEPARPYHVLNGTRLWLRAVTPPVMSPVTWSWRFPAEPYTLRVDGSQWQLSAGENPDADVVVETTPHVWAELVTCARNAHRPRVKLRLLGSPERIGEFNAVFGVRKPSGAVTRADARSGRRASSPRQPDRKAAAGAIRNARTAG
jgi:DNA-binding HxlR family transcriptional regulator